MARVYELVTRHFIASVSQDAAWKNTKIELEVASLGGGNNNKGKFMLRGKEMISPGFLAVLLHKEYGDEEEKNDLAEYSIEDQAEEVENLPEFQKGEVFVLSSSNNNNNSSSSNVKGVVTVSTGPRATLGTKVSELFMYLQRLTSFNIHKIVL